MGEVRARLAHDGAQRAEGDARRGRARRRRRKRGVVKRRRADPMNHVVALDDEDDGAAVACGDECREGVAVACRTLAYRVGEVGPPDEGRNQRSSEVIRGHQRPSEVIRGHQGK